jgi:hypothetical protein
MRKNPTFKQLKESDIGIAEERENSNGNKRDIDCTLTAILSLIASQDTAILSWRCL